MPLPNLKVVRRLALAAVALLALAFVAAASARDPRAEKLRLNARRQPRRSRGAPHDCRPAACLAAGQGLGRRDRSDLPGLPAGLLEVHRHRQGRGRVQGRVGSNWSSPLPRSTRATPRRSRTTGSAPSRRSPRASPRRSSSSRPVTPRVHVKAVSAKQVAAPRLGERSARYKIVLRFTGPGGSVPRTSTPSCSRRAGLSRCSWRLASRSRSRTARHWRGSCPRALRPSSG